VFHASFIFTSADRDVNHGSKARADNTTRHIFLIIILLNVQKLPFSQQLGRYTDIPVPAIEKVWEMGAMLSSGGKTSNKTIM